MVITCAQKIRLSHPLWGFLKCRAGLAAVETAIILPFLLLCLLAGFETVRYINMTRQMTIVANSLASMLSTRTSAAQFNDVVFAMNSTLVTFPQVLGDPARGGTTWYQYMSLTASSILFSPTVNGCTSGCTYKAKVDWSLSSAGNTRSCSVAPASASDTAAPTLATLPSDVFTAGSLIVVDITYPFVPIFGSTFFKPITFRRSAYLQPRYLAKIPLVSSSGGNCP